MFHIDLPKLESVIVGNEAFQYALTTRFESRISYRFCWLWRFGIFENHSNRRSRIHGNWWSVVSSWFNQFVLSEWVYNIDLPKLEKLEAGLECFKETRIYFLTNIPIVKAELDHESAFKKAIYCNQSKISLSLRMYLE